MSSHSKPSLQLLEWAFNNDEYNIFKRPTLISTSPGSGRYVALSNHGNAFVFDKHNPADGWQTLLSDSDTAIQHVTAMDSGYVRVFFEPVEMGTLTVQMLTVQMKPGQETRAQMMLPCPYMMAWGNDDWLLGTLNESHYDFDDFTHQLVLHEGDGLQQRHHFEVEGCVLHAWNVGDHQYRLLVLSPDKKKCVKLYAYHAGEQPVQMDQIAPPMTSEQFLNASETAHKTSGFQHGDEYRVRTYPYVMRISNTDSLSLSEQYDDIDVTVLDGQNPNISRHHRELAPAQPFPGFLI